eukprot:GFUD01036246.1.p1 GENE.GFUD01036246.1~~GFUD01036246.1.p1  ORF type:complete len:669 (+),score=242.58 GFUD01036246.1:55-2061(+)
MDDESKESSMEEESGEESLGENDSEGEGIDSENDKEVNVVVGDGKGIDSENDKEVSEVVEKEDPSKLNKERLNTLIVSLRPCISQAKVHLIHQLARQVAGLKKKKCANDQEKSKNERKVARFVEEISILKRANKDIISRWLVVNNKTFAEVTKKETLTQKFNMRVRVFVRTGEHKAVKKVLEEFRTKHPQWEKEVPKTLRTLGKKRKKTDPNKQELGIKPLKSGEPLNKSSEGNDCSSNVENEPKTTSKFVQDGEGNTDDDSDNDKDDESSPDSEEEKDKKDDTNSEEESNTDGESDTDDGIVHHNDKIVTETNTSETDEDLFNDGEHVFDKDDPANYSESDAEEGGESEESDVESDSGDEEIFVTSLRNAIQLSQGQLKSKEEKPSAEKPTVDKLGKIDKKSGEMLVKVLDLEKVESENEDGDASGNESEKLVETGNKMKISSFFVGGESESEEENEDNLEEDALPYGENALEMRQESLRQKFQREGGFVRGGRGRGNNDRGSRRGSGVFDNTRGRGRGDFDRGRGRGDFDRGRGRGGDFQQRGRGRGDFQRGGRGKTFNESGGGYVKQPADNIGSGTIAEVDSNLHPSWAAKKRVNTTIAKFEGKKIKFGDDGDTVKSSRPAYVPPVAKPPSTAAPSEKLHPSWAAKQNQKSSIQAFQGKKVVFGD